MIEFFIKKRTTTIVLFLLVTLFGTISLNRLSMDLLPDISFPTLTIVTVYSNVSPSEIETLVTKPIEEIVSSVSGVDKVSSESIEGVSIVTVRFRWGTDMDQASIQTREKVDLVKASLPQDVKKSIVLRFDPNNAPIMQVAVEPESVPLKDIRFFLKKNIIPYFERVDGIAAISVSGGLVRQIQVNIDRAKLYAFNLSIDAIAPQLEASNFNFPAGNIKNGNKEVLVRTDGALKSLEMIRKTVVGLTKEGLPIYLENIAEINDLFKERTSISKFNKNESVALVLKKEAGKNTVKTSDLTKELINELNEKFKGKIKLTIISDQSIFIRESIESVATAGILAIIICYFVLFFFLGTFKEPIIVISAVPLSILITFVFMYFYKVTINTMSLGGLAIGVGMVVDSATVVLESIYQRKKIQKDSILAAIEGTKEVVVSILGSTATTCVVFLPVVFVEGMAGAIFGEFALTITFSLISAALVSVTLVPVLSLLPILQSNKTELVSENDIDSKRIKIILSIKSFFVNIVSFFYNNPKKLYLLVFSIVPFTIFLYFIVPAELMPEIDQGEFTIKIIAREGTPLAGTEKITDSIVNTFLNTEKSDKIFSKIGYEEKDLIINPKGDFGLNRSEIFVKLKKGIYTDKFLETVKQSLKNLEETTSSKFEIIPAKSLLANIFSSSSSGVEIEITGQNLEGIKKIAGEIETEFKKIKHFREVNSSFREQTPEYRVELDRDKMAFFGINVDDIAINLRTSIKGEVASKFRENDFEFDILVRVRESDRFGVDSIGEIPIRTNSGQVIKLSTITKIIPASISRKIMRSEGARIGRVSAGYANLKQSEANKLVEPILQKYQSAGEYSVLPGEGDKETKKSFEKLAFAGILAIILIYMTMASQFENFILPLVVMLSIVMVGVGSFLALLISGNSLNIISIMGLVMLSGLVVNNAIILIEYYEMFSKDYPGLKELIVAGTERRVNTILNTSITTILGLLPAALSIGGKSPQEPMAVVVIGGMLASTVLTMIIIPIFYGKIRGKYLEFSEGKEETNLEKPD